MWTVVGLCFLLLCSLLWGVSGTVVRVDATLPQKPFTQYWKESVGSGHALLGTRSDWQAALRTAYADVGFKRVRMHGIFDDDMSVVLEDGSYQFYNVDKVYDAVVATHMKPIVELSFMPRYLANCSQSAGPNPCQYVMHYDGIIMPPADFADWTRLVGNLAAHLVSRYGLAEVQTWYFEVWNELWGMPYNTLYKQLYEASWKGLKSVNSGLKIGGPATEQCKYVESFVADFAGKYDFVSSHLYPSDPNCTGSGDYDCFANTIIKAKMSLPKGTPFFLTEYNAGLFNATILNTAYAAAFVFRNVPLLQGVLDIWSYWTFSDIFEENGMHAAPFDGFGYGIQTIQGIKKPVYRAFELLNAAGWGMLSVGLSEGGLRGSPNKNPVSAFATREGMSVNIFLSNWAPTVTFPSPPTASLNVSVKLPSITMACPSFAMMHVIDDTVCKPYDTWLDIGAPAYPTPEQLTRIEAASVVPTYRASVTEGAKGECTVSVTLRPFAAVRIDLSLKRN